MSNKFKIFLAAAAVAMLSVGFVGLRYYNDNKRVNFSDDYVLYVYPEMSSQAVLDSLISGAGVLRTRSLERCFDKLDVQTKMIGTYSEMLFFLHCYADF